MSEELLKWGTRTEQSRASSLVVQGSEVKRLEATGCGISKFCGYHDSGSWLPRVTQRQLQ